VPASKVSSNEQKDNKNATAAQDAQTKQVLKENDWEC